VTITADDVSVLRRDNVLTQAEDAVRVISKRCALLKTPVMARIDLDLVALTGAEGLRCALVITQNQFGWWVLR
jgi:hypothetical protein